MPVLLMAVIKTQSESLTSDIGLGDLDATLAGSFKDAKSQTGS
jgi:hypothetical protein